MTLDSLWDFDDAAASEARFRGRLASVGGDERLETLSQLARAQGLQGKFDDAHATLDEVERSIAAAGPRVRTRYLLERGRVLRSGGRPQDAIPIFSEAQQVAHEAGEVALMVDALHMLAITVTTAEEQMRWHVRGIAVASSSRDPAARRWLPSLRNNLGWTLFDAGRLADALAQFEQAAVERRDAGDDKRTRIADWAVARTLRALGRIDEALAIQRRLHDEWAHAGGADPHVDEEVAECLLALGRADEARPFLEAARAARESR